MSEDRESNLPVPVEPVIGVVLPPEALPAEALPPPPSEPPKSPKPESPKKPARKRSGTARWHMSNSAVDISLGDVYRMSDAQALEFLIEARWGTRQSIRCTHCGTIGPHRWRGLDKRWKCCSCRNTFSVTSGTVFTGRKLALQDLIAGTLMWVNSSGGQPALELKRHWKTSYNTAYTLQHKVREALVRGYNVGLVCGDLEMDGSHQSGRRSDEKRGKPQATYRDATAEENERVLETDSERQARRKKERKARGAYQPEFGTRNVSPDRRIVLTVRKRSNVKGRGAVETRVAIGFAEDKDAVRAVMADFVACPESYLNSDESPTYKEFKDEFLDHRAVKHSETFSGPNGENNNLAEEFNARMDRAERGTYLNIEPKYMADYAVEVAFRCDTRRMPNRSQLKLALNVAMNVGPSQYWRGFTHGRHRAHELTHPQPRPARASGPAKGRHPISAANGRPPR